MFNVCVHSGYSFIVVSKLYIQDEGHQNKDNDQESLLSFTKSILLLHCTQRVRSEGLHRIGWCLHKIAGFLLNRGEIVLSRQKSLAGIYLVSQHRTVKAGSL